MGENKTGRFGIRSANTIRRTHSVSRHLKVTHNGQFKIVKTLKNVQSENERVRIMEDFAHQLDDGGLEASFIEGEKTAQVEMNPIWASDLVYSMNKKKRWLLPDLLQYDLLCQREDYQDADYSVVLVERETSEYCFGSKRPDCLSVTDSKSEKGYKAPKNKKYAYASDLLNKNQHRPSKKKRSKKQSKVQNEENESVSETEGEAEEPKLIYEVCYARPKDSFPLNKLPRNCELPVVCGDIEKKSNGRRGNKSKMNWKLQHYDDMDDDMWIEDYLYGDDEENEDEDNEYLTTVTRQPLTFNLMDAVHSNKDSLHTTQKDRHTHQYEQSNRLSGHPGKHFGKGDFILTGEDMDTFVDRESAWYEMTKTKEAKVEIKQKKLNKNQRQRKRISKMLIAEAEDKAEPRETKASVQCIITDSCVRSYEGKRCMVGQCMPLKVAVDITLDLINNFKEKGDNRSAEILQDSNNHSVYILFEATNNSNNNTRVTLFGISDLMETTRQVKQEIRSLIPHGSSQTMKQVIQCITSIAKNIPVIGIVGDHSINRCFKRKRRGLVALETVNEMAKFDYLCQRPSDVGRQLKETTLMEMNKTPLSSTDESIPQSDLCGICYNSLQTTDGIQSTALSTCKHWFCNECWELHVTSRVESGQISITCPAYNCETKVDAVVLMAFLSTNQYVRYWDQVCNMEISKDRQTRKFCPSPNCGQFIGVSRVLSAKDPSPVIQCECGYNWCWHCRESAHWPATCLQADAYRKRRKARGLLDKGSKITEVKVKPCPECNYPIQKNGGCQWMSCRCRASFCWLCLKHLNDHDNYKCVYPHKVRDNRELVPVYRHEDDKKLALYFLALERSSANKRHRIMLVKQASQKLAKTTFWRNAEFDFDTLGQCRTKYGGSLCPVSTDTKSLVTPSVNVQTMEGQQFSTGSQSTAMDYTQIPVLQELLKTANKITTMYTQLNFITEYLAILVCYTTRRQQNPKVWQILEQMKFFTGQMDEILAIGRDSTSKNTWDRLVSITERSEKCIKQLVRIVPSMHQKLQHLEY